MTVLEPSWYTDTVLYTKGLLEACPTVCLSKHTWIHACTHTLYAEIWKYDHVNGRTVWFAPKEICWEQLQRCYTWAFVLWRASSSK